VWTGSELLCWNNDYKAAVVGMRYNPANNAWSSMTITHAPAARSSRSIVWTGSEMIVWGGQVDSSVYTNTGAIYNPDTDVWKPITSTDAPAARYGHKAVWAGDKMIIFGGMVDSGYTNTGALYPVTDTWVPVTTTGAPPALESMMVTINLLWTGSRAIVWPWSTGSEYRGAIYDPSNDTWTAMTTNGAPSNPSMSGDRFGWLAWTGSEMVATGIIAGGGEAALYFYDPDSNTWRESFDDLLSWAIGRRHPMVVAGNLLFTYSGVYDLAQDRWLVTSNRFVSASPIFWTGNENLLAIRGAQVVSYTINLVFPYVKD
jgi:hypothetical protein